MKKGLLLLLILTVLLGFSGAANAFFGKVGTANYGGTDYNLIYEGDLGGQGLVWLDYTKDYDNWYNQVSWASGLNGLNVLQYNVDPGFIVSWNDSWRLPITDESKVNLSGGLGWAGPDGTGYHNYRDGYNMVNSEMAHLFYESLGNKGLIAKDGTNPQPGWGLISAGDFNNLQHDVYWSGTEYSRDPSVAWYFVFWDGFQHFGDKDRDLRCALAVRPGEVSFNPVPIPGAVWLFASGLIGLLGFGRKFRNV